MINYATSASGFHSSATERESWQRGLQLERSCEAMGAVLCVHTGDTAAECDSTSSDGTGNFNSTAVL